MIIDDVIITVSGGNGGNGIVRFNKTKMSLGPTGGSGGKGGDVFVKGVSNLGALRQFRFKKNIKAEKGENGKFQLNDGRNGKDLILLIPVGTIIYYLKNEQNLDSPNVNPAELEYSRSIEITKIGQTELIAKGGIGGKGNFLFRSATNTSPMEFGKGKPGEFFTLRLELKIIADVGFIGLPNVGKSSLLNELTNAHSKVANYAFTTLEPNLGAYYDLILGDIPGIIEGASTGKGLGIKFLQHIERTNVLFHLISAESADPIKDYKIIRAELETYSPLLLQKNEYLFLSKSDEVSADKISEIIESFTKIGKQIIPISITDEKSMDVLKKILNKIIEEKTVQEIQE